MKLNRKEIIAKKIELKRNNVNKRPILNKKTIHEIKRKGRIGKTKQIKRGGYGNLILPDEGKIGRNNKYIPHFNNFPPYVKKENVDFDVIITIGSHDRYEKVHRMLSQFFDQKTKYSFKIVLLNDGSKDNKYDTLKKEFKEIFYIKNKIPNGKVKHWYNYNQLWNYAKLHESHCILQMDDDFILCDNFLDKIMNKFFIVKEENSGMFGLAAHMYSFNKYVGANTYHWKMLKGFVDGICLYDSEFIKYINYELDELDPNPIKVVGASAGAWGNLNKKLIEMGGVISRTDTSLVWHDGNGVNQSKLHVNADRNIYTAHWEGSTKYKNLKYE